MRRWLSNPARLAAADSTPAASSSRCGKIRWGTALLLLAAAGGVAVVRAEEPKPADAVETNEPRVALDQLNRDIRALYRESQVSLLRVQLPAPRWANAYALAPLNKWSKLSPEMRQQLEAQQGGNASNQQQQVQRPYAPGYENNDARNSGQSPRDSGPGTTNPTTGPGQYPAPPGAQQQIVIERGNIIFVRPATENNALSQQRDNGIGGRLEMRVAANADFSPNLIGLVIDQEGHVLVPLYVEREACIDQPIRLAGTGAELTNAKFIGSDRQTNLSLLQLEKRVGKPVRLGSSKPDDGSIVLYLSPTDGSGRIGLWTGGAQDYGFVVTTDGRVAGITRYGQFLSGSSCRLIADAIIRHGSVKRATLGALITEIHPDDPTWRPSPALTSKAAMRVDQVIAGSPAERGGLRRGDLLLAIAGEPVSDIPSLAAAIAECNGATDLQVLREDEVVTISVELRPAK